jgi:hypothetical protein
MSNEGKACVTGYRGILRETTTRYTPMPSPTENHIRLAIVQRHQRGETLHSISAELGLSYETTKHIWQHWKQTGSVEPNYERAKQRGTRQYQSVYAQAVEMKRAHPRWGAQLIRLELQAYHREKLPSVRTLQRWFRQAGVNRSAGVKQVRNQTVQRGQAVHQVWAVDAKEGMHLRDGSWASWLVVSDEASGAILRAEVFPPAALDTNQGSNSADQPTTDLRPMGASDNHAL